MWEFYATQMKEQLYNSLGALYRIYNNCGQNLYLKCTFPSYSQTLSSSSNAFCCFSLSFLLTYCCLFLGLYVPYFYSHYILLSTSHPVLFSIILKIKNKSKQNNMLLLFLKIVTMIDFKRNPSSMSIGTIVHVSENES